MRIFNKEKTKELTEMDIDYEKGYLVDDKLFIAHHKAVQAVEEQGHYETVREYPNGGKDVEWVVDVAKVEAREAYDEYEEIQVFTRYTTEELARLQEQKYSNLVEEYIRKKYSLNDELALLRQRDSKPNEFVLYNTYAENCKKQVKEMLGIVQ